MLASSASAVTLGKKMTKPETKTVTPTVTVPKTKTDKQEPYQHGLRQSIRDGMLSKRAVKIISQMTILMLRENLKYHSPNLQSRYCIN